MYRCALQQQNVIGLTDAHARHVQKQKEHVLQNRVVVVTAIIC